MAPHDPVAIDFGAMLAPPGLDHPFGTDAFGRDILSRIIYGARTALMNGVSLISIEKLSVAVIDGARISKSCAVPQLLPQHLGITHCFLSNLAGSDRRLAVSSR